jgi:molybdate transport system regulatory protein
MSSELLKIRISRGAETAMGPGKADLLDAIQECGSISSAAKKMQMSYRRAWELVDVMNRCFKSPLVESSQGGAHGGGAVVSELGLLVLQSYRDIQRKATEASKTELDALRCNLSP